MNMTRESLLAMLTSVVFVVGGMAILYSAYTINQRIASLEDYESQMADIPSITIPVSSLPHDLVASACAELVAEPTPTPEPDMNEAVEVNFEEDQVEDVFEADVVVPIPVPTPEGL